ncbi:hypothetical protein TrCOL_g2531 [Triparma columacea]|nr:hypothetical protein TrCOL_g2531 [Triparma columacea]
MPIQVPLWLALSLRQTKRCRLVPPPWLTTSYLQAAVDYEKDPANEAFFTAAQNPQDPEGPEIPLPHHYHEAATAILDCAAEDLQNPKSLPPLLSDLSYLRSSKSSLVLKRLSHTLESRSGTFEDGAPDVVYNMQSGWKSHEVQVFKGVTYKLMNTSHRIHYGGDTGPTGGGGGGGRRGGGGGGGGRRQFGGNRGRRNFEHRSNRGGKEDENIPGNGEGVGGGSQESMVDEDGLELAAVDEEELMEPMRMGGEEGINKFR